MAVTLTGENEFMVQSELAKRVQQFVAQHGDMALERLDGEEVDFERIQEALQSLPFLAPRKMVVVWRPSANKRFIEQSTGLLDEIPETTDLILVEPKLDKRSTYYKYLKQHTDYLEYAKLERTKLAQWLVKSVKEQGGTLSLADANFLSDRVGENQQLLAHEIEKLLLYDKRISRDTITLLTESTPQSTVFELLEAAFAGKNRVAMRLYAEQRQLKIEPQQIIAMLTWQLHVVALVKTAGQRSPDVIASEAKLNPYVIRKAVAIANRITTPQLKDMVAELLEIDTRLKRENIDADEALQNYLLKIAS